MPSHALRVFVAAAIGACCLAFAPPASARPAGHDKGERIGSLTAAGKTYRDVEVLLIDDKAMHIRHRDGVATIPLAALAEGREARATPPPVPLPAAIESNVVLRTVADTIPGAVAEVLPSALTAPLPDRAVVLRFFATFLLLIVAVVFALWVFASYCCLLICRKAGHEPGVLIWVPILQSIPLLRAADMSLWWWLTSSFGLPIMAFWTALLSPDASGFVTLGSLAFNLVYAITWCVRIVRARGKSGIWALLLLLPITNVIAFLYLAFSDQNPAATASAMR